MQYLFEYQYLFAIATQNGMMTAAPSCAREEKSSDSIKPKAAASKPARPLIKLPKREYAR